MVIKKMIIKKFTLISIILFMTTTLLAQTPQAFKYQAVARDASGNVLSIQNVSFQLSILQGSAVGISVYTETHATVTNEFGLVNLEIGNGTLVSGNFSSVD
jgi:predicted MFS family arabinose efflux permease